MRKLDLDEQEERRHRYRTGAPFTDEEANELRQATSTGQWIDMERDRSYVLAPRIVPGKSDLELAQQYRQRALDLLEPLTALLNEAQASGMTISFGYTPPDAFGRRYVASLEIVKKLA